VESDLQLSEICRPALALASFVILAGCASTPAELQGAGPAGQVSEPAKSDRVPRAGVAASPSVEADSGELECALYGGLCAPN